jgi:hypothetical protein
MDRQADCPTSIHEWNSDSTFQTIVCGKVLLLLLLLLLLLQQLLHVWKSSPLVPAKCRDLHMTQSPAAAGLAYNSSAQQLSPVSLDRI